MTRTHRASRYRLGPRASVLSLSALIFGLLVYLAPAIADEPADAEPTLGIRLNHGTLQIRPGTRESAPSAWRQTLAADLAEVSVPLSEDGALQLKPELRQWRFRDGRADAEIHWTVEVPAKRHLLYRLIATVRVPANKNKDRDAMLRAIRLSVPHLMADGQLARQIEQLGPRSHIFSEPLSLGRCLTETRTLPADMDAALKSVVLIRTKKGHGSGVAISPDGWLLTAAHVVDGAESATIKLQSGDEHEGRVFRSTDRYDAALIHVPEAELPCTPPSVIPTPIGSEIFIAGAPLSESLGHSVSKGVVSARRQIEGIELLQTDAKVNPGNSGGPFLDAVGQVAGVALFKVSGDGIDGIGFGLSVTDALRVLGVTFADDAPAPDPALAGRLGGLPKTVEARVDISP